MSRMKVLVVTAHDAVNLSVENIVRELIHRGHDVSIYARTMEHRHIRMFEDMGLPVQPVSKLTSQAVKRFDCAFCPMDAVASLTFYDIYIFSYNFIFNNRWTTAGGDFMFVQTEDRPIFQWEDCARMAIGTPKNDTPVQPNTQSNKILYVDTGHYPFGLEGKQQIAKTLLNFCKEFPQYEFVVKPRKLPDDVDDVHRNNLHLYRVISDCCNGQIPENLCLLDRHMNMQQLIDECITVITPGSSAYLDAALRGKGILILGGLTSENSYDLRTDTVWKIQFGDMADSGCLVDYEDAVNYLPYGLKCREEHLNKVVAYRGNVSEKVVDVIEYIYTAFLAKNQFPAIERYNLTDYRDKMQADHRVNYRLLQQKRMKNQVLILARRCDWVQAKIDYSEWLDILDQCYREYKVNQTGLTDLRKKMIQELYYIWIKQKDCMMEDSIDQAVLLQALYDTGNIDHVLCILPQDIHCIGPYHYYLGMIYRGENEMFDAIEHFVAFLIESNSRSFNQYPQEEPWGIRNSYEYLFRVYDGTNISPSIFLQLYAQLYQKGNEKAQKLVKIHLRKRAHNFLPQVAQMLEDQGDHESAYQCLSLYARYDQQYNIGPAKRAEREAQRIRRSKTFRIGSIVLWLPWKVRRGIQCARDHGIWYTVAHFKSKVHAFRRNINNECKRLEFVRIYSRFQDVKVGFDAYAQLLKTYGDQYYFITPFGSGDAYIVAQFYQPYIEAYWRKSELPELVVAGKIGEKVANLCGLDNVKTVSVNENKGLIRLWMFLENEMLHGKILHWGLAMNHTSIIRNLEGIHDFNMFSFYKYAVFNGVKEREYKITFSPDDQFVDLVFQKYALIPGKTILLVPYSNSLSSPLPKSFWIKLVRSFIKEGYSVCTNVGSKQEEAIPGTKALFIPIDKLIPFLDKAGCMISVRTGLADITVQSKCKRIVLYPQQQSPWSLKATYHEMFSINAMFGKNYDIEIEYRLQKSEEIIPQILSYLDIPNDMKV